jgi:serine/threonine protein kinase/TolB-like protein/tetratricopeptide (TPR) repeat protein
MHQQQWQRIKEIFALVIDHPDEGRRALLDTLCDGDAALRREVASLLDAHDATERPLEPDAFGFGARLRAEVGDYAGRPFGAYRIVREIGRGGMGTVFLAERADGQFERQVALKVVRRSLADPELERRFKRERQILATLTHPHIAHLLDGGVSADGEPFLVMEYVDGVRIDEYCARHALPTRARLKLFLSVCRAVAYAHGQLVVHRDLKPSNILVSHDGVPKLLDFGIARLLDLGDEGEHTATQYRVFTPDYAAPEQVRGEQQLTPATDVYSLGVLLGVLLGMPASARASATPVSTPEPDRGAAGRTPQRDTSRQQAVNRELRNIIAMARRDEPQRRYPTARELGQDIERHLDGLPVAAQPDTVRYRASKYIERRRTPLMVAVLVLAALATGVIGARYVGRSDIRSDTPAAGPLEGDVPPGTPLRDTRAIAVLPLKSRSATADVAADQALRVGMADALVTKLGQVRQLAVRPTSATVPYLDQDYDAVAVGRALKVDTVLEGTLQREGSGLRIRLQLVNVSSGQVVWAETITSDMATVLRGQESLANRVSHLLALNLSGKDIGYGRRADGSTNLAAQEAFLRGSLALATSVRQFAAIFAARDAYEQAIRLDPDFAPALAGLANTYTLAGSLTLLAPQEAYPKAERAARRALELDPDLAVAYIALAEIEADYNWNWAAAEENNRRALALAPNSAPAHQSYAEFLARMGRFTEASSHADLAQQLDPTRINYPAVGALHAYYEHRFPDAIARATRVLEADPTTYLAYLYLSVSHAAQGQHAEGIAAAEKASALTGGSTSDLFVLACNYAVKNDREATFRVIDRLLAIARGRYVDPFLFVAIYAYLGDRDRAFEWMERAYAERSYWMTSLRVHPVVNALRGDPRFAVMMQRMKLD